MLKSLFSGVSGLQSHQIAMDVESNNIANVNTTGFKYSRANFSDLLAQTKAIATAPQGELGGKNAVQIGLGSTVSSMTRIFSQGSVQNSDKNTDVAIQGDGFFIVSPDGGNTYKYTRSGDFKFDAGGNFVDNNGFIAQGWLRDTDTGIVDSTAPITNINIAPGLTTPANASTEVVIKANLNSGQTVESFSPAYEVKSGTPPSKQTPAVFTGDAVDADGLAIASGNMGVMFNETGEAFSLQQNQGIWASFLSSTYTAGNAVSASTGTNDELNITFELDNGDTKTIATNGATGTETAAQNGARYVSAINAQTAITGVQATFDSSTSKLILTNTNGTASASHNIRLTRNATDNSGLASATVTTAYRYQYDPAGASAITGTDKTFTTVSDLRYALEQEARNYNSITPSTSPSTVTAPNGTGTDDGLSITIDGTTVTVADSGAAAAQVEQTVTTAALVTGDSISVTINGNTYTAPFNGDNDTTMGDLATAISAGEAGITAVASDTGAVGYDNTITATADTAGVPFTIESDYAVTSTGLGTAVAGAGTDVPNNTIRTQDENGAAYASAINLAGITGITAVYDSGTNVLTVSNTNSTAIDIVSANLNASGVSGIAVGTTTMAGATLGDGDATLNENNIEVIVTEQGNFQITNPGGSPDGDYDMNLRITGMNSDSIVGGGITENTRFTRNMEALNAVLPAGSTGKAFSQSFNAATHSSSIDIFDSLGSKHTLRTEFRKTALDTATGSTWDMEITVPQPATIDTIAPTNQKRGSIRFNNDGSLATYNPPNLSFSGNNGSAPDQQVSLSLGTANAFDGMTSFDSLSSTSGISQDGYTGGDLVGIRIDQSGTLVGSFSNGRSFGLAQISMAKFTNNEGLGTEGGNIYTQSANSGDPIIGTAATAGRGFIQASALEASNVDLSRALTQLIIIQRGFQANGKTITTSDQLLQTLIGLKN